MKKRARRKSPRKGATYYSRSGKAEFDFSDGYVGICQGHDRVFLSPAQVKALLAFIADPVRYDAP